MSGFPRGKLWLRTQGKLVQAEYHLSLSRTVAVRKHQIQPLLADLRRCLQETARRAVCHVKRLHCGV